ncbi:MAG TPA: (2Fe-2S)-binding protein [Acidimicrobiales bacterium]|nr:(2Fe-2S)-binding protein [Acidimicrobiales bacterium]
MTTKVDLQLTVNGRQWEGVVEPRVTLADFLRVELGLTGTHLGCEQGVCGACTVLLDDVAVRSCIMFAVQADGRRVVTIEGVAAEDGTLHPLQEAFWRCTSFQCGFCTPGFVAVGVELLAENPDPTDDEIRAALSGNLCRCTGYQSIIEGVREAARLASGAGAEAVSTASGAETEGSPAASGAEMKG